MKKVFEYDKTICPFRIISMETDYRMPVTIHTPQGPLTVYVEGDIDRVDQTDKGIRVIDYKTGSDKTDFKTLESIFDSTNKQRNKAAFQTLLYCMMFEYGHTDDTPVLPGIYSTKLLFSPDYSYFLKCNNEPIHCFRSYENEFRQLLVQLLEELFSPDQPFEQNGLREKCKNCPYRGICHF